MILCCGEALIDMLPRKSAGGEEVFAPHTGGSVFNTAVALGRIGADVGYFGGLSTDLFGTRLADVLDMAGVDHGLAPRSGRPTTLAFVTLHDGHAKYAFYDENTAARMVTPEDLPTLGSETDALFFGCISLVAEPCGTAYEALMMREVDRLTVMVDTNIRPSFVTDEPSYRARLERMIARADAVKFSDDDLLWYAGEGDADAQAREIAATGPKIVCLTRGGAGVTAYGAFGRVHVDAPRVEVVDTVGAGDTFNAGFLAGLKQAGALSKTAMSNLSKDQVEAALSYGARAAAITVSRAGANPPWQHEL